MHIPRPILPPKPVIGFNQYLRERENFIQNQQVLSLAEYRNYLQRRLPSNSFQWAMLEPLKTPAMRKKKMESMNKFQRLDYLEQLKKFNDTGAPESTGKIRLNKQLLETVHKRKLEQERSDRQ